MQCPTCDGQKVRKEYKRIDGKLCECHYNCRRCAATGEITDRQWEWMENGSFLKLVRMQSRRNLVTEAAARGISVQTLGEMELGLIEPIPPADFWSRWKARMGEVMNPPKFHDFVGAGI